MLLYFTGDGLCSLEQVVDIDLYFRGAVQLFSFSFSGDFFSGEGNFLGGVFSFWSGGGAFFGLGDMFFFFTWGGGSPLVGEKRAFMAEPSARPAINDRLDERRRCKNEEGKKTQKSTKKWEKKNLSLFIQPGQKISAQPGEVVAMI